MKVVTLREFYANQNKYFEMIANEEQVIIKQKDDHYKIVPVVYEELFKEEGINTKEGNIYIVIILSTIGNIEAILNDLEEK